MTNHDTTLVSECAHACWFDDHGTPYPAEAIPSVNDLHTWINTECPIPPLKEADKRLEQVLGPETSWLAPTVVREAEMNSKIPADVLNTLNQIVEALTHTRPKNESDDDTLGLVAVHFEGEGDGARVTTMAGVITTWEAMHEDTRPAHPLAPIVRAWQQHPHPVEPYLPTKRANLPALHQVTIEEAQSMRMAAFKEPEAAAAAAEMQLELDLPSLGPAVRGCPSWLLWLFDRAGGSSMSQGRGAPWELRLFIGALLHLPTKHRDERWHTVRLPVYDTPDHEGKTIPGVVSWLHPKGWANRRRDWDKLPAAFEALKQLACVQVNGDTAMVVLMPTFYPTKETGNIVEFTLRVPASGAHGARIDWPTLCTYGAESAMLYRGYLSVSAYLDQSAHRGHAITAQIGAPIRRGDGTVKRRKGGHIVRSSQELIENPAARFVSTLTEHDIARMFGVDPENRMYRHRAVKAANRMQDDGIIELQQVRKGRAPRALYRILGPRKTAT